MTLALLLGVTAFMTAPALNARMFNVAESAPTLAGATTTSSFNIGNTVGPWLGGLVISAGWGYEAVAWTGAALAASGVVTTALSSIARRRDRRRRRPGGGVTRPSAAPASSVAAAPRP